MGRGFCWSVGILLFLLWFRLVHALHVDWKINPQYSYGWGVPLLGIYLFWKRWQSRPDPEPVAAGFPFFIWTGLLGFSWLPLRLVHEANPDWRFILWTLALTVVGLTLSALWFEGGWRWTRHFCLSIAFILIAVPWPTRIEQGLIQTLMREVTTVTAECMNWLGVAASARGNLIELPNGLVGVNEACSGVRSFQATLMVSIFVGELYLLPWIQRLLLVATGLIVSIVVNFLRSSTLAWLCAKRGADTLSTWHDPAGYLTLGFAIALVWGIGARLGRRTNEICPVQTKRPPAQPAMGSAWVATLLAAWILLAELGTEIWYRTHENFSGSAPNLTITWPGAKEGFQSKELPEPMRVILRCDESRSGTWRRADGGEWTMFYFKWRPGRMSAQLARGHTPDVCLPASGFKRVSELGFISVQVHGLEIPFHTYVFEGSGRLYYVFFALLEEGETFGTPQAARAAQTYLDGLEHDRRMRAVWAGQRHGGHQVLEIAMTGYASQEAAQQALARELRRLVLVPGQSG